MYSIFQLVGDGQETLEELTPNPENVRSVILPPAGVVGLSNLFERGNSGYSVVPTQPSSNRSRHNFLSGLLGLRMALPLQGNIIYLKQDSAEVRNFFQYLRQTGLIRRTPSVVGLPVEDTLDIQGVIAAVKKANLVIHPYQHRRALQELCTRMGVGTTAPVNGFSLYEELGDKGNFHSYLMQNGREDICAPLRKIISQGAGSDTWNEGIQAIIRYSELYAEPLVSRLYIVKDNDVLLEQSTQTPWLQTMVLQDTRGCGGMGTIVISRNQAKTKWLKIPSDGGPFVVLNSYEELISLIEEFVKTSTITATPYLITEVVDGQEQSFSFCITWRGDRFVIAGPHWQRLVNKAFDGFYYNGPSNDCTHVAVAREFAIRFAVHLLRKGLWAQAPLRAGIDFFSAILPNGERMLIAQDPNMRDTATVGLPLVTLVNHGLELLSGQLVLSQSDHNAIAAHGDCRTLRGAISRLKSRNVPLFGSGNKTGVVLESTPKMEEDDSHNARLLVGFVAPTVSERRKLESAFGNAFAE